MQHKKCLFYFVGIFLQLSTYYLCTLTEEYVSICSYLNRIFKNPNRVNIKPEIILSLSF